MNISILTLFPELYEPFFKASIIGRACEKGIINSEIRSFFDYSEPKERIDSPSYGHGPGMLIRPDIVEKAIEDYEQKKGKSFKIFFSPHGKKLTQPLLKELIQKIQSSNNLMLIAGRYEGMDSRVENYYADEILSIGEYVLMGGDLPAMVFLEGLLRLIPGIVGKQESVENESFSSAFVDYPEYTQPVKWKGIEVPEVLRSGNHGLISEWRNKEAAKRTVKYHFDWLKSYRLSKDQIKLSKQFIPNHYAVLMHSEVLLKDGTIGTTSVTSLDIHDIARSAATYDLKNYFIVTPLKDQQEIVKTLLDFWKIGYGAEYNIHRHQSVQLVNLNNNFNEVVEAIELKEGKKPIIIATSAKVKNIDKNITFYDQEKVWTNNQPVLFVFGTGHGLSDEFLNKCDYILDPIYGFSEFNHLSVRAAASIIFDRWLGIKPKFK